MNNGGWIKLSRSLLTSRTYNSLKAEHRVAMLTILLSCNYDTSEIITGGEHITVGPGQVFLSASKLAELCSCQKITRAVAASSLRRLKELDFLSWESHKTGYLITITNWDKYQMTDASTTKEEPEEEKPAKKPARKSKKQAAKVTPESSPVVWVGGKPVSKYAELPDDCEGFVDLTHEQEEKKEEPEPTKPIFGESEVMPLWMKEQLQS